MAEKSHANIDTRSDVLPQVNVPLYALEVTANHAYLVKDDEM